MERKLSVLGSPISHSKSPEIHAAAYRVLGLDWDYERNEVRKGGLVAFMESLTPEWLGLSLTMPLKEEAFRYANSVDRAANATKAVNTLVRTEMGWAGFNTDVFGIVQAVHQANLGTLEKVLIVGSGATATSAVAAVSQLAPRTQLVVWARNKETRAELIAFARQLGLKAKAVRRLKSAATTADLTIATLPGGALDGVVAGLDKFGGFKPRGAVLDVAYKPWPSVFASGWQTQGRTIISGLEMLLWQAVAQIRIFTTGDPNSQLPNEAAVVEAMRHALN